MKPKKILLILAIYVFLMPCFGQEIPKAVLTDEFREVPCDELLARISAFRADLANNPVSTGYIIIYPEKNPARKTVPYVHWINAYLALNKMDEARLVIIQGKERDERKVEFWRVPPGAEANFYEGEKWVEPARKKDLAFVFASLDADQICPTFNPREYAKILLSDLNLRGHMVVFNQSRSNSQETAQYWLKMLTEEYKVPRDRLKVFFSKTAEPVEVEFWIVPRKKK